MNIFWRAIGGAALLAAGLASAAAAQNAPTPPAKPNECISDSGGFQKQGGKPAYVIALENKCEKRIRCRVFANVTTARDSKRVSTTMTLAPHAQGAKAKHSYVVRIKLSGGVAQVSRECKFL